MSKTAVSTLQEYMAKRTLGMPNYILTADMSLSHLPTFTYKVICGKYTAQGSATTKKEAKHNAAKDMLKLLPNCDNNIHQLSTNRSILSSNTVAADSYYLPGTDNLSYNDVFVNSVGKLNEFCVEHRFKDPKYVLSSTIGPDHSKLFTIRCSIGSVWAEGTANTKKQAKHEAAQEMYQKLIVSKGDIDLHKEPEMSKVIDETDKAITSVKSLDLKMEELSIPIAKSAEKALELFPKLRNRASVKIEKNIDVQDFHKYLCTSVTGKNRALALQQLANPTAVSNETLLKTISELLNLEVQSKTLKNVYGACVVCYTIDTIPVITDVGSGKSLFEAKELALANLLRSVDVLLR